MTLHIFGIRHHGPGCARSLLAALEALQPDILLVEGPPDAAEALPLIAHEDLKPPVALLVYAQDEPRRAAFYPFATYSPEWQALRYAVARGVPARFIDLPQSIRIAATMEEEAALLAALEAAWRADISLVKLDLNAAQRRAQVQLSAQSLDALFGFVERLKQNRARVTLERHAFDERQPPEWALQASLTVNWS